MWVYIRDCAVQKPNSLIGGATSVGVSIAAITSIRALCDRYVVFSHWVVPLLA